MQLLEHFADRRSIIHIVAGLVFIAFLLRIYGINDGLPYLCLHIDEETMVQGAMEVGEGINPRALGWPGTVYMFLLSFLYAIYFVLSNIGVLLSHLVRKDLLGLLGVAENFYISFYRDASNWYLIGRFATVLIGTATIYVTYLCGRRIYGTDTGVLAALLLTFMQLHVAFSHYTLADAPMAFLATLAFLYSYYVYRDRRTKHYILAGLLSGFAVATKFNAGVMVITIFIAHLLPEKQASVKLRNALPDKKLLLAYGFLILGFYVGCPYILVQLPTVLKEMSFSTIGYRIGRESTIQGVRIAFGHLWNGMGSTVLLLAVAGVMYSLWKHTKKDILTLSFPIIYLLSLINSLIIYPRYVIPVLPFLALIGARALAQALQIITRIPLPRPYRTVAAAFVICSVMTVPVYKTLVYEREFTKQDTRIVAKQWIEANIPTGSRIAMYEWLVPLAKSKPTLQRELAQLLDTETIIQRKYKLARGPNAEYPYVILTNIFLNDEQTFIKQAKYALKDPEYPDVNYDIVSFSHFSAFLLMEPYQDVIRKAREGGFFDILVSKDPIEELGTPVKVFAPSNILSGSTISIYKLSPKLDLP